MNSAVIELLQLSFRDAARWPRWPKPFHLLQGALLASSGTALPLAARSVGTSLSSLKKVLDSPNWVESVLKVRESDLGNEHIQRVRKSIGQLVLGRAAEVAFEEICRNEIDQKDFSIVDLREGRSNTDYRLIDSAQRPLFRFNVKYFGSVFRRGAEMVGLQPDDCFPLATYKIEAALKQQDREHLPYIFAVVRAPIAASVVADQIPVSEVLPIALLFESEVVTRKRDFEDWYVDRLVTSRASAFLAAFNPIASATWFLLSARRADKLLRDYLFDRVYALRVPRFTKQFGGAEVDMHFSLSNDLVRLNDFFAALRREGQGKVTAMLERGTF